MKKIFFFNDTATTEIYTLSLHDALPICSYTAAFLPDIQDSVELWEKLLELDRRALAQFGTGPLGQ